jgi:hypothetical protein
MLNLDPVQDAGASAEALGVPPGFGLTAVLHAFRPKPDWELAIENWSLAIIIRRNQYAKKQGKWKNA